MQEDSDGGMQFFIVVLGVEALRRRFFKAIQGLRREVREFLLKGFCS